MRKIFIFLMLVTIISIAESTQSIAEETAAIKPPTNFIVGGIEFKSISEDLKGGLYYYNYRKEGDKLTDISLRYDTSQKKWYMYGQNPDNINIDTKTLPALENIKDGDYISNNKDVIAIQNKYKVETSPEQGDTSPKQAVTSPKYSEFTPPIGTEFTGKGGTYKLMDINEDGAYWMNLDDGNYVNSKEISEEYVNYINHRDGLTGNDAWTIDNNGKITNKESINIYDNINEYYKQQEFLSQGLNIPLQFGSAFGTIGNLLGPDEWNEGWRSMFPDWFAGLTGIDDYINYYLCEIPIDEDSVSTSIFLNSGEIGAHIEGYRVNYNSRVSCDSNQMCNASFNRKDFICYNEFCSNANRQPQTLKTNIYRITFMFDPSEEVVKEDETVEFDIVLYPAKGTPKMLDINKNGKQDDNVKLSGGGSLYQKAGNDQIVFLNQTEYDKVCMKFKNVDAFTEEFKSLLKEVGDGSSLCNSFVNENSEGNADVSALASFLSFGTAKAQDYTSAASALSLGTAGGSGIAEASPKKNSGGSGGKEGESRP